MASTGQPRAARKAPAVLDDPGYIMVVLLIGMAVAAVWMGAMLPAWRQQAQREREAELIYRGEQYARAIALYFRKNQQLPRDIDVLVSQHYLRRKYKDPITNAEFLPIGSGVAPQQTNPQAGRGGPARGPGTTMPTPQGVQTPQVQGPTAGIFGVRSTSQEISIRVYQGQTVYALFPFDYQLALQKMGTMVGPGGQRPGAGQRGGRGDELAPLGRGRGGVQAPGRGPGVRPGGPGPAGGRGVTPGGGPVTQPVPGPAGGRGRG